MKFILSSSLLLLNLFSFGQDSIPPPPPAVVTTPEIIEDSNVTYVFNGEIIDFPDVEAEFPGGSKGMQKWIIENVIYPESALENNLQGRVFLSFIVEIDGSISNIVVERGVTKVLDEEGIRLLKSMPKWSPGEAKKHKVRTRCRLPINFKLTNPTD